MLFYKNERFKHFVWGQFEAIYKNINKILKELTYSPDFATQTQSAPNVKKFVNKSLSFDFLVVYFLFNNYFDRNFMSNPNFDSKVLIYLIL